MEIEASKEELYSAYQRAVEANDVSAANELAEVLNSMFPDADSDKPEEGGSEYISEDARNVTGTSTVTGMTPTEAQSRGEAGLSALKEASAGTAKFIGTKGADMAVEGGLTTLGQVAGVPFAPITGGASVGVGGAIGGYAGNSLAQLRQILMGERGEFSNPEAIASGVAGTIPGGQFVKGTKKVGDAVVPALVKRSFSNEASRDVAANVGAEASRQYLSAEEFDLGKLGVAAGMGVAGTGVSRQLDKGKRVSKKTKIEIENTEKRKTFDAAAEAGYKIPPSSLDEAGTVNNALEYIAGSPLTMEEIRKSNQMVTNALARKAIGLPDDEVLNLAALKSVRKAAGDVYGEVAATSPVMDRAIVRFRKARDNARAFWKENDKSGSVKSEQRAKQFDKAAKAEETKIKEFLEKRPDGEELFKNWEKARKTIAKTHAIEDAFNVGSGNVRADIISKRRKAGHYVTTDELEVIDRFAEAFEKSSKPIGEGSASAISHPLLMIGASTAAYAGGNSIGGPGTGLGAMSAVLFAPKAVREMITSDAYQRIATRRRYDVPMTQDFLAGTVKYGTMGQGRGSEEPSTDSDRVPNINDLLARFE